MKAPYITYIKFDQKRFKATVPGADKDVSYWVVNNWVMIGSLGDPETWEGLAGVVSMKKGAKDGLAGTLIDMNVMQEILYSRPSGYENKLEDCMHFTHRLQSILLADENSVIKRETILAQIKHTAVIAKIDEGGRKFINLYYSGHGEANTGNWVFKDGVITL